MNSIHLSKNISRYCYLFFICIKNIFMKSILKLNIILKEENSNFFHFYLNQIKLPKKNSVSLQYYLL